MKYYSITFFLLVLFSLTSLSSIAQCHVEKKVEGDFGQIYSRPEILYKNGFRTVLGNIICAVPLVDTSKKMQFFLKLDYIFMDDTTRVELRQVTFKFKSKKYLTIIAASLDTPDFSNGVNKESSIFRIEAENYNQIMNDPLESITVTDTRTKKYILMKPYDKILIEQNNCIIQTLVTKD